MVIMNPPVGFDRFRGIGIRVQLSHKLTILDREGGPVSIKRLYQMTQPFDFFGDWMMWWISNDHQMPGHSYPSILTKIHRILFLIQ